MLRTLKKPVKALARSRRFRRATSRARLLPAFLVIGANTADTTVLFRALRRHPDVIGPKATREHLWSWKELRFFDDRFWRGVGWYRSFFPFSARHRIARRRGRDIVAGESTPSYLFHPAVPARVAAALPDVRVVVLLRNPVVRACTHYEESHRKGLEHLAFENALAAEEDRLAGEEGRILADPRYCSESYRYYAYVTRGLYADQLERWFAHLPREQMLILRAEDYIDRPAELYASVLSFLGLSPHQPDDLPSLDRIPYSSSESEVRTQLEERFAEPNARLARLLGRDFGWTSCATADRVGALPVNTR